MLKHWSRQTLRTQVTLLVAATFLFFVIVTIAVEYRVLQSRGLDRARISAVDFAVTVYPVLIFAPETDRSDLAARLHSPNRSTTLRPAPAAHGTAAPPHVAEIVLDLLKVSGHSVADVVVTEHRSNRIAQGPITVDISMRPPDWDRWIVASSLSAPAPLALPLLTATVFETVVGLGVLVLVLVLLRRLTAPLQNLGQYAQQIRRGEPTAALPVQGGVDLRTTITAFNQMSESIAQTIAHQQSLLQSLGHDLKAPLARVRALVERDVPRDNHDKIDHALDDVETILGSITDFTRATLRDGAIEPVDLTSLIDALAEEADDRGHSLQLSLADAVVVPARYFALARALRNLIENAATYGDTAHITLTRAYGMAVIHIDDNGPGIEECAIEDMFRPFNRLSNRPGGAGLGLAIARTIIVDHGGSLTLRNRPEGGLRQTVLIPG